MASASTQSPLVLGIETSCDETSAAIVSGWRRIRSNIVVSQDIHADWGGVVPELAAREHLRATIPAVREAMKAARVEWRDLSGIAVTAGPGLVGSLLVGISVAKSLAYATGLPLVGVNHLEGHLFSLMLEDPAWRPPYLVLIVSGGHTELQWVHELGEYVRLGGTLDDAAGEAFDKVGVILGLPYPAGPALDRLAEEAEAPDDGQPVFPVARVERAHFSFSGLKTAVLQYWQDLSEPRREQERGQVAAAFREAVVTALMEGVQSGLEETDAPRIAVAGGVASNRLLRRRVAALAAERGIEAAFPSPRLCTDNAAMIAAVGAYYLAQGRRDGLDLDADPSMRLASAEPRTVEEDPPGGRA